MANSVADNMDEVVACLFCIEGTGGYDCGVWEGVADVHMVLGDVSMEQENFESAAEDYAAAQKLLEGTEQVM